MSKIYMVASTTGALQRFVRAQTKAGALRAVAAEYLTAEAASVESIMQASAAGSLDILDALADKDDPGPVPALRAVS